MTVPTFSLAYTSVRSATIPHVIRMWEDAAIMGDFEWVLCVDAGDAATLAAAEAAKATSRVPFTIVVNNGSKDCVAGWNTAAAATTGKVIIAVADDFVPLQHWDAELLKLEPAGWQDGEFAVHVEDGYVHSLMVLPIITRKRYDRFGYLFYPKYRSMFCDTELTEVAYRDGVVIQAKHLLFEHMHPDCGKRNRDANDLEHASRERWNVGEMLFNFRKAAGFPVDDGPKAEKTTAKSSTEFAVYMQVTQDDICLQEVCVRMMEEGCREFFFAVPDTYWSGEAVPEEKLKTLDPVFAYLTSKGANVHVKQFQVARYRMSDKDDRITVETRLRNDSLTWIRKSGFERILIVDGDELWIPGTLDMIKPYVERGDLAISVRMIPVIGTPGYPVEGATDVAVVYIGPKCNFRVCRTPTVTQTIIEQPRIIHFTSTRRTPEDNKAKHLRSGHYGDPDYDFDGWMEKVLPSVKPGMRDVHMYRPYSIWKSVRAWRSDELAIIPSTIHPYLGLEK